MGRDKSGLFEPAVREYGERLTHYTRFEVVELAASTRKGKGSRPDAQEEEGQRILKSLKPGEQLWALDERGVLMDSLSFAKDVLGQAQRNSVDLAFVVGGDEGLSPQVRQRAHKTLSLSPLVLPHRLARLVLIEQLYRGFTILRGEPYHK